MKTSAIFLAACLAAPISALATDPIQVDVQLPEKFNQTLSLKGNGSFAKFTPVGMPETELELRLIAPEPLIVDFKETTLGGQPQEVTQRVKLLSPGSTVSVDAIKGAKFHNTYVLVRKN